MVEANENSTWTPWQLCHQKGIKRELYKLMDKFFVNQN